MQRGKYRSSYCYSCSREMDRARQHQRAPQRRLYNVQRRYGLSPTIYETLKKAQNHACAICGGGSGSRDWHIDHDHKTGEIRGLLCHGCNVAIGLLNDDPHQLRAALNYLETRTTGLKVPS